MSPLRILIAVAGVLALLFLGPVVYYTGKHVGLYFVCVSQDTDCWESTGTTILQGVRGPQPS
jgi:hypothetical protein